MRRTIFYMFFSLATFFYSSSFCGENLKIEDVLNKIDASSLKLLSPKTGYVLDANTFLKILKTGKFNDDPVKFADLGSCEFVFEYNDEKITAVVDFDNRGNAYIWIAKLEEKIYFNTNGSLMSALLSSESKKEK